MISKFAQAIPDRFSSKSSAVRCVSRQSVAIAILISAAVACDAAETTLHVSPAGPLHSLTEARDEIRQRRADAPDEKFRVIVADGRYEISEPIVFEAQDGNVVYQAAEGAAPVISGGRQITTPWTATDSGVWSTQLPQDWRFDQLWINGNHATRAREPDHFFHYMLRGQETLIENARRARQTLTVDPDDIASLQGLSPEQIRNVQFLAFHKWDTTRRFLESADTAAGRLVSVGRGMKSHNPLTLNTGYILENYREAMDEPGEWFLAPDGLLSYRPREGESMDTIECIAPVSEKLVVILGDAASDKSVENLEFHGLAFRHSGLITPREGFEPSQAASPIEAAVQIDGAQGIVFADCEIGHTGQYGLWFRKGCRDSRIERCWIHDLGAGGVRIGETRIAKNLAERTSHIVVDNSIVNHGGHMFPCAVGIWIGHSGDNQITHNEIADLFYTGISVGWRWGYSESLAARNRIEHNHIHHIGQGWLSDMGGIYTLGPAPGTVLRGNRIHDIDSWGYGGWGLYNDEGSTDILLENNLVYRTKSGGYHQHYGRDNIIRNNIFAYGREYQVRRSRVEDHLSFTYEQNIVLFDSEELFHGRWGDDGVKVGRNLYWRGGAEVDISKADTSGESVIADPRFVDPKHDDFRFIDTTAADKIGFKPFDVSAAGVYGEPAWKEKAASLPMPEMLKAPEPRAYSVREDFESGELPLGARVSADKERGGIEVVEVDFAQHGSKALRFTDTPDQPHAYYPMMSLAPKHSSGTTRCRFMIRLGEGAVFQHEWRDAAKPFQIGPSLWIEKGVLKAKDGVSVKMPVDQWIRIEVAAQLGQEAGHWHLRVTVPGQEPQTFRDLTTTSPGWQNLDWVGFVSQAKDNAVVYLDDLELAQ
ncbi:hypothetical protein CA51_15030 [Rosistilla oblonga]|uniref:right-handed parallel beta-helix repeat-containing protein n=1 Tax=Rosistilla oblonga TaxID=2527990 RepID=UPI00118B3056|nr:right-handed parallel beta-helix repeat-containing protein [Rosistilla oblonga]QDV11633.1 hypothetical protein CA51_15030 [Rosistilla oblonga]